MDRHKKALARLWWSLTLALVILLMPSRRADAQMVGFAAAAGPSSIGYANGYPMVNYPFTSFGSPYGGMGYGGMGYGGMGYGGMGYGGMGYGGMGYGGMGYGGMGYGGMGYGGVGYGMGYGGMGYGGMGYGAGYAGFYGTGWNNPMFGVGLTPLGTQSYMTETRLFNRTPRVTRYYYPSAYRGR
jgi:hypothetical protein